MVHIHFICCILFVFFFCNMFSFSCSALQNVDFGLYFLGFFPLFLIRLHFLRTHTFLLSLSPSLTRNVWLYSFTLSVCVFRSFNSTMLFYAVDLYSFALCVHHDPCVIWIYIHTYIQCTWYRLYLTRRKIFTSIYIVYNTRTAPFLVSVLLFCFVIWIFVVVFFLPPLLVFMWMYTE